MCDYKELFDGFDGDINNLSDMALQNMCEDLGMYQSPDNFDNFNNSNNLNNEQVNDLPESTNKTNNLNTEDSADRCPKCKTMNCIVEDTIHSIAVCTKCGQVIRNLTDRHPEWRQFEDDNKNESRCSAPINPLLPQSSVGTTIACSFRSKIGMIHSWGQMPYKERSLNNVFKIIQSKCALGSIIKCIEDDAKIMYKTISECKHIDGKNKGKYIIIRGKNRQSLIAACVFHACKRGGKTRSPKEIADLFGLKYTEITKGCKNFAKLVKLRKFDIQIGSSQPEHFVIRFCNELKIKKEFIAQALQIAKNIRKLNIASVHTPFSIAATSILLMAEHNNLPNINKSKLHSKFKVSEVTIEKTYEKIQHFGQVLLSDESTDKLVEIIKKNRQNIIIPENVLERFKRFEMDPYKEESMKYVEKSNNPIDFEKAGGLEGSGILDELDDELDGLDDLDKLEDPEDPEYSSIDNINICLPNNIVKSIGDINNELYVKINKTNELYNQLFDYN